MENNTYLFTSESVSSGHPDKICDQISDAILDEFLRQDSESRVAVECFITKNMLVIGGEATSHADVNIIEIAKDVIRRIGYNGNNGFDVDSAIFINTLHEQSPDIAMGVNREEKEKQGAGDQGIMFGYATNETPEYLPATLVLANATLIEIAKARNVIAPWNKILMPDAKCQYTIEYDSCTNKPLRIKTILISTQHADISDALPLLHEFITYKIIPQVKTIFPNLSYLFDENTNLLINPTGRFVIGGPEGDTGLTGRKIIVDTYGGRCPHGGGAFSGKDPSKVDRSAAYAARYIAKNIVAAGVCNEATVQLAYAIGKAEPLSINIKCDNSIFSESQLVGMIKKVFPLTPYEIIEHLNLKTPCYLGTAVFGHFGKDCYSWEELDKVNEIKEYLNIK